MGKNKSIEKEYENLRLGCSFSPEHCEHLGFQRSEILDALKVISKDFMMKEIRFGIRWDKAISAKGEADLSYYRPYLDYLLDQDISLCLNIGPVKTFRWPEEHVPKNVINKLAKVPSKKATIGVEDKIASPAYSYIDQLLNLLRNTYTTDQLSRTKIIQIENEAFHHFGKYRWTFSQGYLLGLIQKVSKEFPKTKFLFNSAGRLDLNNIVGLIKKAKKDSNLSEGKFVVGIDYYYKYPGKQKWPILRDLDNLQLTVPWSKSTQWNISNSRKLKYDIEVTEAQFEPWGEHDSPGANLREFEFVLKRCRDKILDIKTRQNSLIRLWGIELFTRSYLREELTQEQQNIVNLIQEINKKSIK